MKKFIVFFMVIFMAAVMTGCLPRRAHELIADYKGDVGVMYKTNDADYRMYNYQWFYDQYNGIVSTANNVKLLDGDEKKGTLMVLNSMIGEYNSKASQEMTATKWKGNTPYHIELSDVYRED